MSLVTNVPQRLVLVRHSNPLIGREVPAREWQLSAQGVRRARELASLLTLDGIAAVYSSVEPKALSTASAIADIWEVPVHAVDGIHEHDRSNELLLSPGDFEQRMRDFFARPSQVVFGTESADVARRRFTAALVRLLLQATGDLIVVTHGTVLALFVGAVTGGDSFAFWRRLDLPCAVTLTRPELKLVGITHVSGREGTDPGEPTES